MSRFSVCLPTLHTFPPYLKHHQPLPILPTIPFHRHKNRQVKILNQNLDKSSTTEKSVADFDNSKGTSTPKGFPRKFPSKDLKKKIAIASFLGAMGLLLSTRLHFFGVPSKDHCAHAFPSEEAQHNGKPTVVEFDAD
ncbi:thioredoxin-like protein HCF164, chloroplastic [Vigna umbellata]|uniref:thioredoxin-like protein HCF164, chloroplastic n=1 Tax=Vigna umbellata TaxID=87088 RepID=UPI001F5ED7A4|nr:thioredoxin-like protein HCF164, chloroplastic [Vigna umbellata]